MSYKLVYVIIAGFFLLTSCDVEKLLKTTEEPEVSDIFSDASGFIVQPMQTTRFWVIATNPEEGVLTYQWSVSGGEISGSRQNDTLTWRAPVTGGQYSVKVDVSNSDKSVTRNREISVPSLNAPQVDITSPKTNEYLVQESTVIVNATAFSENGIFKTDFYVNDSLVSSKSGISGNNYEFSWIVREKAGPSELKISATARQTGLIGRDSIVVNVEGIIPGKLNAGQ
jgi:hypothetical protein